MSALVRMIVVLFMMSFAASAPKPEKEAPKAPSGLRVSTRFEGAMAIAELRWTDHSENELGFEILRSGNGDEFRVVGMAGADTVRIDDEVGKYISGAFVYKVRAFNEAGTSQETRGVSVWF